ncbi:cobalamin biosynthesis protein [Streptomyces sp. AV19]|nr:cobalamin biosynthesis protein [Streptomyces sp. AV19]MBH1936431.1 cobalamin biosynthesis protein [Streptomyces sp. AV19]MDG4532482.1 cobalamin biosynthesis protein [Streptomyces sp. AV19]
MAGVGARPGVPADEVLALVRRMLPPDGRLVALSTLASRAAEPGLIAAASALGVPLLSCSVAELSSVPVPSPSARVRAATGTASVAEAAAVRGAGDGAVLVVPKVVGGRVTCAVAARV